MRDFRELDLIVLLVCLILSWFFSGIETGLISLNKLRLHHMVRHKVRGSDILQWFLQRPDAILGTTLVGNNIVNTAAASFAASLGLRYGGAWGSLIASALLTVTLLVFCEYFPKAWFQSHAAHRSLLFAPALRVTHRLLRPLSLPLMVFVRRVFPLARAKTVSAEALVTREDIVHLARQSRDSGILTAAEHKMIHEVMELKTKPCRELMIPRDRMVCVNEDAPVGELIELARAKEFNRFPVFNPVKKTFVGLVHIFDVLAVAELEGKRVADFMRPPQFVADYMPADHALPRMRVTHQPMMLVSNDRFEVIGLITLEDVLDEVVGAL